MNTWFQCSLWIPSNIMLTGEPSCCRSLTCVLRSLYNSNTSWKKLVFHSHVTQMGIQKKLFLKRYTLKEYFKENQKKNWTVPKSLFFITYIFFQIRQFYTEWHKMKLKLPIVTHKLDSSLNENRTKIKILKKAPVLWTGSCWLSFSLRLSAAFCVTPTDSSHPPYLLTLWET